MMPIPSSTLGMVKSLSCELVVKAANATSYPPANPRRQSVGLPRLSTYSPLTRPNLLGAGTSHAMKIMTLEPTKTNLRLRPKIAFVRLRIYGHGDMLLNDQPFALSFSIDVGNAHGHIL
jgi:hypothetical protein